MTNSPSQCGMPCFLLQTASEIPILYVLFTAFSVGFNGKHKTINPNLLGVLQNKELPTWYIGAKKAYIFNLDFITVNYGPATTLYNFISMVITMKISANL